MNKSNPVSIPTQASALAQGRFHLEQLFRQGAQRLLQTTIENEVQEFLEAHALLRTSEDRQAVVPSGSLPARRILTGLGPLEVRQPRVRDQRPAEKLHFTSNILPKYLRRVPSVDALIPAPYLHGISTGDFTQALEAILGPNAAGLSAANVVRLKLGWEEEYEKRATRDQAPLSYATRIKAPTSGTHRAARHQTPPQTLPVTQPSAPQICRTATSQLSLARWTPQISIL